MGGKRMAQNMAKKMGGSKDGCQKLLVENMAVNNLRVCNMAEMKYKIENKFPFQIMATNVETSE